MNKYKKLITKAMIICMFAASSAYADTENYNDSINISEDDAVYVLPNLAVDAERTSYRALISRPGDSINSEQISNMAVKNPIEMLRSRNTSVVLGTNMFGAIVCPLIRGLKPRFTAVTADGISTNTPWNWASFLCGLPMARLKKITVANTGQALVYGQNTVAGAVNYSLPTGRDNQGLTIVNEIGGEGTAHQEYMVGLADENSEHIFALFSDEYDGNKRFSNGKYYNNRRDNKTFYYKGSIDLKKGWNFTPMFMRNDGSITLGDVGGPGCLRRNDPWRISLNSYALNKDFADDSNMTLRYTKYHSFSKTRCFDETDPELQTPLYGHPLDGSEGSDTMKTTELLYNFPADEKNYVNIGISNMKTTDGHDSVVYKKFQGLKIDTLSFFAADSIRVSDRFNIHAIVRSDENLKEDRDTSYSLNTNYDLTDRTSIGAGFSHTVQAPSTRDLYTSECKRNGYGNPDLENEESDNYEIRLAYRLNKKWRADLTAYHYDIDDMIAPTKLNNGKTWIKPDGTSVTFDGSEKVATNVDKAKLTGYELGLNGQLNEKFNFWLSYTNFDKAEQNNGGEISRIADMPDFRAAIGLDYKQGKTSAGFSLFHQSDLDERTERYKKKGGWVTDVYPKADSSTIADFYIKQQVRDDFSLYIKVHNIGDDKDVVLSQSMNPKGIGKNAYTYAEGRIVTVGAEMKF